MFFASFQKKKHFFGEEKRFGRQTLQNWSLCIEGYCAKWLIFMCFFFVFVFASLDLVIDTYCSNYYRPILRNTHSYHMKSTWHVFIGHVINSFKTITLGHLRSRTLHKLHPYWHIGWVDASDNSLERALNCHNPDYTGVLLSPPHSRRAEEERQTLLCSEAGQSLHHHQYLPSATIDLKHIT